jgi:starch synthase
MLAEPLSSHGDQSVAMGNDQDKSPAAGRASHRSHSASHRADHLDGAANHPLPFSFAPVPMKILFVAPEGLPYSKTGGLADVIEGLPRALRELGHQVAVVLPRYRGNKITSTLVSSVTVSLGDTLRFPALTEGPSVNGARYFFVDDPEFFDRPHLYGNKNVDYPDNAERFTEFSRAAIEFAKRVWLPDVIHCHDWQTALLPVLLRTQYAKDPVVRSLPVVLTIHNLGYQGIFPPAALRASGLPDSLFNMDALEFFGNLNLLKGGLIYADYLTTVSRRYAKEIQTPEFGFGLEGILRNRAERLVGILNGVDYAIWSPEVDSFIAQNYSVHNLDGKKVCKKDLLAAFHLPEENMERPLIGIVSRFVDHKGFDLIAEISNELANENIALAVLGTGEAKYETLFRKLAEKYPTRIGAKIGYDNLLAHKIEAGADLFLMPSRYEPCGLNQIYSLRYGTAPIVRATGGLDDTIQPFDAQTHEGTGFKFETYAGVALLDCIRGAIKAFRDRDAWRALQSNGMAKDFSWKAPAAAYVTVYEAAKRARIPRVVGTSK